MAEAEVRFKVPRGLKEEMEEFPEVKWSEIAKETFLQEVKRHLQKRFCNKKTHHLAKIIALCTCFFIARIG